jgi:golgi SNAP receptor complex member 2
MSADPSAEYAQARRIISQIEIQLQELEGVTSITKSKSELQDIRQSISENINLLESQSSKLDRLIDVHFTAVNDTKKDFWKRRLSQLHLEIISLRKSVEQYLKMTYSSSLYAQEREQLLNNKGSSTNSGARAVAVDALLKERSSVSSSNKMMSELSELADNVLSNLKSQRSTLKNAHKRVLDIANTLGISNSIIKIIERRTVGDKILVYGGFFFILLLIFTLWYFVKK